MCSVIYLDGNLGLSSSVKLLMSVSPHFNNVTNVYGTYISDGSLLYCMYDL